MAARKEDRIKPLRSRGLFCWTSRLLLVNYLGTLLVPQLSWGVLSTSTNPTQINQSSIQAAGVDCDSFCSTMVGVDYLGNPLGSNSNNWGTASDYWCQTHGSINAATGNSQYRTNPNYISSNDPSLPSALQGSSALTVVQDCGGGLEKLQMDGNLTCDQLAQSAERCAYHGSQAQSYCMAYNSAFDGSKQNTIALSLDATALGACATACALTATGAVTAGATVLAAEAACTAGDIAASVGEIASVVEMSQSPTAQTIRKVASYGTLGVAGAMGASAANNFDKSGVETTDEDVGDEDALEEKSIEQVENEKSTSKMACASAAIFAGMLGLRIWDRVNAQKAKTTACNNIQSLVSNATTATSGSAVAGNNPSSTPTPLSISGSGGTTSSSSNPSSSAGGTNTSSVPNAQIAQNATSTGCPVGQTCTTATQSSGSATSGGMLSSLPPDQSAGLQNMMRQLQDNGTLGQVQSAPTGAQAVNAALGNLAGSDLGRSLASVAGAVDQNPNDFLAMVPSSTGGRAPSSTKGKPDSSGDPLGIFKAGKGTGPTASANATLTFGDQVAPQSTDIWHASTSLNLFEIVSGKIGQVTSRVSP